MDALIRRPDQAARAETGWSGAQHLPVRPAEVDLAAPLPDLWGDGIGRDEPALVLVRLHRAPIGMVRASGPTKHQLAQAIWQELGTAINGHLRADGLQAYDHLPARGLGEATAPLCQKRRRRVLADPPAITVVVATRERPQRLAACLESLLAVLYSRYEVVVVDNDPATTATADLIESCYRERVLYIREDRRGLAAAHNRGLAAASGTIVAFTDDDVVVDPDWLAAIAEGFQTTEDVGAVTGLILPAELNTPAQMMLERHGGFAKGFSPRIFDLDAHRPADPLFPFTAGQMGSGANMAFDTDVLRRAGGFDPAIGVGTRARGGDDLAGLFSVVGSGHRVVYQPGALVWHWHRREWSSLQRQVYGYGVGLGAYLTSVMVRHPQLVLPALRRLPSGCSYAFRATSPLHRRRGDDWPKQLMRLERRGLLWGPFAYLSSRWRTLPTGTPS
jgi:glycosyltransferase involved in cell wall biosynthesis